MLARPIAWGILVRVARREAGRAFFVHDCGNSVRCVFGEMALDPVRERGTLDRAEPGRRADSCHVSRSMCEQVTRTFFGELPFVDEGRRPRASELRDLLRHGHSAEQVLDAPFGREGGVTVRRRRLHPVRLSKESVEFDPAGAPVPVSCTVDTCRLWMTRLVVRRRRRWVFRAPRRLAWVLQLPIGS